VLGREKLELGGARLGRERAGVTVGGARRQDRAGAQLERGDGKEARQHRIDTGAGDRVIYLLSLSMPSPRFRFQFCDLRPSSSHRRQ
jgi:hypothetical protein